MSKLGPVEDAVLNLIRALTKTDDEAATLTRQVLEDEAFILISDEGAKVYLKGGEAD